jgi:hypothetical protein
MATTDPQRFHKTWRPIGSALALTGYAVAIISIND